MAEAKHEFKPYAWKCVAWEIDPAQRTGVPEQYHGIAAIFIRPSGHGQRWTNQLLFYGVSAADARDKAITQYRADMEIARSNAAKRGKGAGSETGGVKPEVATHFGDGHPAKDDFATAHLTPEALAMHEAMLKAKLEDEDDEK